MLIVVSSRESEVPDPYSVPVSRVGLDVVCVSFYGEETGVRNVTPAACLYVVGWMAMAGSMSRRIP